MGLTQDVDDKLAHVPRLRHARLGRDALQLGAAERLEVADVIVPAPTCREGSIKAVGAQNRMEWWQRRSPQVLEGVCVRFEPGFSQKGADRRHAVERRRLRRVARTGARTLVLILLLERVAIVIEWHTSMKPHFHLLGFTGGLPGLYGASDGRHWGSYGA